jgi:hypothetical membrane protein
MISRSRSPPPSIEGVSGGRPWEYGQGVSSRLAAWAGIIGPLLFTACFLLQEGFRQDEYSPMAEPVSALEAGPNGWIQQVNFVVLGVLTFIFAFGLHRALRETRLGLAGPLLIGISGVANILAAVFPLKEDAAGETYDPGGHMVAGILYFLTSSVALLVLSHRLRHDDRWRGLAAYVAAAGALALVGFVLMGTLVIPDDAPLHDWAGLGQRVIVLAILFPPRILIAQRMLSLADDPQRTVRY